MMDYPDLFVLRHGETEWNAVGRHQGHKNSDLTALGREQAQHQGGLLQANISDWSDVDVFSSPLGRTRDTAHLALQGSGKTIQFDDRLKEVSFGAWEGLTGDEIEAGWPEIDHSGHMFHWHFSSPGGESFDELHERAKAFLDDLTRASVIVTHGITSRMLRGIWLGGGADEMAAMPGGQGCVHHLSAGKQTQLRLS